MKPARDPRIVFFDLETGGVHPDVDPVIQFAGIAVKSPGWETIEELELKLRFNPEACSPEALRVNSYDEDTWAEHAVYPSIAVKEIAMFLKRHATVAIEKTRKPGEYWWACQLAGHNAATFDRPFLQHLFEAHDEFCVGTLQVLDTLQLALWGTWAYGERTEDHKLGTLCEHYGIKLDEDAHDALADVRANVQLAKAMTEDLFQ